MSYRESLTYMICLFFALITILAGPAKSAQAAPGGAWCHLWHCATSVVVGSELPATAPASGGAGSSATLIVRVANRARSTGPGTAAGRGTRHGGPGAVYPKQTCSSTRHSPSSRSAAPLLATGAADDQPDKPQIPPGVEVRLVVNTYQRTLIVMAGQEVIGVYPVAIGKDSTPTPIGEWKIIDKEYNWGGPFGPRWLGLNIFWGRYGIHGTNQPGSISYEASLGCLRMFDDDVLQIFDLVKVGTQVDIVGEPHKTNFWSRELGVGSVGPDVVYIQLALKKKGFYPYRCDGIFGQLSDLGVRCFQALEGLPVTGKIDKETNRRLLEEASGEKPDEKNAAPGNA